MCVRVCPCACARVRVHASTRSVAQSWSHLCDPVDCSPQAPLSMGFSRQEPWSGLPFPAPGEPPGPGMESLSLGLLQRQVDSLPLQHPGSPEVYYITKLIKVSRLNWYNFHPLLLPIPGWNTDAMSEKAGTILRP